MDTLILANAVLFLSTLSLRRATIGYTVNFHAKTGFLSTLSLRRATRKKEAPGAIVKHFYPRSPCGERLNGICLVIHVGRFLSTLSLRRATSSQSSVKSTPEISIHALLAESDRGFGASRPKNSRISIHALLAESDRPPAPPKAKVLYFYPRSPCGERPRGGHISQTRSKHFYPRSPCGERRNGYPHTHRRGAISIHALLAESDRNKKVKNTRAGLFLSTLSLRRATGYTVNFHAKTGFLSTLSLRRATMIRQPKPTGNNKFLSTLSLRRATRISQGD